MTTQGSRAVELQRRVVGHFEVWITNLPSSDEEGWLRGKEKVAKPPQPAQTGWC